MLSARCTDVGDEPEEEVIVLLVVLLVGTVPGKSSRSPEGKGNNILLLLPVLAGDLGSTGARSLVWLWLWRFTEDTDLRPSLDMVFRGRIMASQS
jgi:hypothetical protein